MHSIIACCKLATHIRLASSLADGNSVPSTNTVRILGGGIGFLHTCAPPGNCSIGFRASFRVAETMSSVKDKSTGCRTKRFDQRLAALKSSNHQFFFAALILLLLFSYHFASFWGHTTTAHDMSTKFLATTGLAASFSHATCTHPPALRMNQI